MLPRENSTPNVPLKEHGIQDLALQLAHKLSAAIQAGENEQAKEIADQLSNWKVKLEVSFPKEENEQRYKEKEFSIKVHVEDRVSDGCFFDLMVKACDTIEDLKRKVMLKHNFPMEVQKWIIGKKIYNDKDKLGQCGIKSSNHTIYLYLVTARSVGLTQQYYEQERQALIEGRPIQQSSYLQSAQTLAGDEHSQWGPLQQGFKMPSSSHSPNDFIRLEELEQNIVQSGMPSRQASRASLSSSSSYLQELMATPVNPSQHPVSQIVPSERPKSVSSESGMVIEQIQLLSSGYRSRTPPRSPSASKKNENSVLGWQCSVCTLINLPTRPGCEACASPRPITYIVPPGYQLTPEEKALIERDQQMERMAREAVPPKVSPLIVRPPPLPRGNQRSSRHSDTASEQQQELTRALNFEASGQAQHANWPEMLNSSFDESFLVEDHPNNADQPNVLRARSSSPSPSAGYQIQNQNNVISEEAMMRRYSAYAGVPNRSPQAQNVSDEEN